MKARLFEDLPTEVQRQESQRRREHLTFRGNVRQGRHGWLRLTPAYSLHVVREILEGCSSADWVLDPFSGTGTTPLASAARGVRAHSVDINPFLVWFGNVKLTRFEPAVRNLLVEAALSVVAQRRRRSRGVEVWVPPIHQIEKWWDRPVLEQLAQLLAGIRSWDGDGSSAVADLLKIAFCRTLIETAHVSFGHQSMSFKKRPAVEQPLLFDIPDGNDGGHEVLDRFSAAVEEMAGGLDEDQPVAESRVFFGDSRCLDAVLPGSRYTTVVTSPPYPNRMSYIRELRPYMYWLGYLSDGRQAGDLDWQAIGGTWGCATSNLAKWNAAGDDSIPYAAFDRIVAQIRSEHDLLGRYVHKYFADIKTHLRSLRSVMAPGGRCWYVVGNSKFYETLLPVEEIYAALFEDLGYVQVRIERLRKRTSKKELYEYVVHATRK